LGSRGCKVNVHVRKKKGCGINPRNCWDRKRRGGSPGRLKVTLNKTPMGGEVIPDLAPQRNKVFAQGSKGGKS